METIFFGLTATSSGVEQEEIEMAQRLTFYVVPSPAPAPATIPNTPISGTLPSGDASLDDVHVVVYPNTQAFYKHNGTQYALVFTAARQVYKLTPYAVTAANMTSKTAPISSAGIVSELLALQVEGSTLQETTDFTFDKSTGIMSWSGLNLDGYIQEGDTITGLYR